MRVDGGLVAKSPSSEKTLISSSGGGTGAEGGKGPGPAGDKSLLLVASNAQGASGAVMAVLGLLGGLWGEGALPRLGAGLSGGLLALSSGLLGTLSALVPSNPLFPTLHLALSLLSIAANTLVLVLTLTAVVRDSQVDLQALPVEDGARLWGSQWCGLGLLGATGVHLLATLLSLPLSCRRACSRPGGAGGPEATAKQTMVQTWLGQQTTPSPHIFLGPHLIRDMAYPSRMHTPVRRPPSAHRYMRRERTPDPKLRPEAIEKPREKVKKKKKEITEEELERTYTGLDREIAEEFISIAMQPKADTLSRVKH